MASRRNSGREIEEADATEEIDEFQKLAKMQEEIYHLKVRENSLKERRITVEHELDFLVDKLSMKKPSMRGIVGRTLIVIYFFSSIWFQLPVEWKIPPSIRPTCVLFYSYLIGVDVPPTDHELYGHLCFLILLQGIGSILYIFREYIGGTLLTVYLIIMMFSTYGSNEFYMHMALLGTMVSYLSMEIIWLGKKILLFPISDDVIFVCSSFKNMRDKETKALLNWYISMYSDL